MFNTVEEKCTQEPLGSPPAHYLCPHKKMEVFWDIHFLLLFQLNSPKWILCKEISNLQLLPMSKQNIAKMEREKIKKAKSSFASKICLFEMGSSLRWRGERKTEAKPWNEQKRRGTIFKKEALRNFIIVGFIRGWGLMHPEWIQGRHNTHSSSTPDGHSLQDLEP